MGFELTEMELPQAILWASGFVFYYIEMFKVWFKPYAGERAQLYTLGVMVASIILGGVAFIVGDGVSDVFATMFPDLPYGARLLIAAHIIGLGSKFTHLIWGVFYGLKGRMKLPLPDAAFTPVSEKTAIEQAALAQGHKVS